MLLPMVGFFFMLLLFGGVGSLAAVIGRHTARRAPLPFAALFASLGFFAVFAAGGLIDTFVSQTAGAVIVLLVAPVAGSLGGGLLGYRLGLRRKARYSAYTSS